MNFETIIGLELHVELKTKSKMFSPSPVGFGAKANANTNAIDWAYPGVLPQPNLKGVELAVQAALALNCEINQETKFDRKNYVYPDNPKAYQITQDKEPIGKNGYIDIEINDEIKRIRIERVHLEEDAGKNIHGENNHSYVDLNRQGSVLLEIVSEADLRSPEEAYAYLETIRQIIQFTGVSDVKMEEGSMRADANISLRPFGQKEFGVKTELKNLNSFSNVRRGLAYEQNRQEKLLLSGGVPLQETRRYDDVSRQSILMRVKEGQDDYRYFPEPNILPFTISDEMIKEYKSAIPEMPKERQNRYVKKFEIPIYDAEVLTASVEMSDFFDATVAAGADPKQASNWLMGDVSAYLNKKQVDIDETTLTPKSLAEMILLIDNETISSKIAKRVFKELMKEKVEDVESLVEEKGWVQLSDPAKLLPLINETLDNNEQSVADFKDGRDRAKGYLIGQIMKATRGQANPSVVNRLLAEELNKR